MDGPFNFDAAASEDNSLCESWSSDALSANWSRGPNTRVWCNPPYSKLKHFLEKAYSERLNPDIHTICMLIPARTDTIAWHRFVMQADRVDFIKGRVKFVGAKHGAPFPSAIVVLRNIGTGEPSFRSLDLKGIYKGEA